MHIDLEHELMNVGCYVDQVSFEFLSIGYPGMLYSAQLEVP